MPQTGPPVAVYELTVIVREVLAPPKPAILKFQFWKGKNMATALTGTVSLSPVNPADNVVHRNVQITLNGNPGPMIDCIDPNASFPCSEGDQVQGVATDVNSNGQSSQPSDPVTVTASATPGPGPGPGPGQAPGKPTILGFTFTQTPTPTPGP